MTSRRSAVQAWHFERATVADLQERRWMRLHAVLFGGVSFGICWAVSRGLDAVGVDSLAWRPLLALWVSYPIYIGLLALWARWLLSQHEPDADIDPADLLDAADALVQVPGSVFRSGGGGDYGGGGASGDFDGPGGDGVGEAIGNALGQVGDGIDLDDAAVIAIPIAVVLGIAAAIAAGLGLLVFGLFGVEVLLGVAVEIAFASVGGALAWRAQREGWLQHALRRTAVPMLCLSVLTAAVGWALNHWVPQAHTLPEALRVLTLLWR
ncbi:hypothetical protein AACH06_06600 [Ideonella sp. DXS29W]|uniref:Uncharacterized protein n=1 Tax=Ideonella lacteola TaxID=2984193 RepID=A0ABU9BKK7_9BURK